jgi:hypothetical protein
MNYCKVINGEKVDGPRAFSGKTHAQILSEGWLPHRLVEVSAVDSIFLGSTWEVTSTEVIETQLFRPMTDAEKLERDRQIIEQNNQQLLVAEKAELTALIAQLRSIVSSLSASV